LEEKSLVCSYCPLPQVRRFWSWPRTEGTPEHVPISNQSNLTCRNWRKYPWYAASCPPLQVRRFWSWPRTEGTPEHVPISNESNLTCRNEMNIHGMTLLSSYPGEEVLELAEDRRDS
jgi:hypothetical protein